MGKNFLTFRELEMENKNYFNRTLIFLKNLDIEKVLVSNKISFGEKNYKYFIGYLYNDKVEPLHTVLPETSACVKSHDGQT